MFPLTRRGAGVALGLLALPSPAAAHLAPVSHAEPGWTFEPWLVGSLAFTAILYAVGGLRLARRSGPGRGARGRSALLFLGGWTALALATVSPLHQGGEQSFTLHMIEHELLMLVSAPLLVLSRPLAAMLWAFPAPARQALAQLGGGAGLRGLWRVFTAPVASTLLQAAALWIWHMPALFDLALGSEPWHVAQHLSFMVAALFFWEAVLQPRRNIGLAAVCLFATSLVAGALGALMAFSESPWYARYAALGMTPFGLTPAEDQQLAGLLMWIPGGLVHVGAALALVGRALLGKPARSAVGPRA